MEARIGECGSVPGDPKGPGPVLHRLGDAGQVACVARPRPLVCERGVTAAVGESIQKAPSEGQL